MKNNLLFYPEILRRKRRIHFIFLVLCIISGIFNFELNAQTPQENYMLVKTYKKETSQSISNLNSPDLMVDIQYFDGLGRPKQDVAYRQAGDGGDFVTHFAYDELGRQNKEYLPYVRSASLEIAQNPQSELQQFYSSGASGATTSNPWSEVAYENSSLSRILKQAAPGDPWKLSELNDDNSIKFSYETNSANEVRHYGVTLTGGTPVLKYLNYYPSGQLYKNVTKNENWKAEDGKVNTIEEYKNKLGQIVLRRSFNRENGSLKNLDTYYVYDLFGNLSFVLPPKLSAQIPSSGIPSSELMNALAYRYRYDHRNRLIQKKIPGKETENMAYDALDRLVTVGPILSPFGDETKGRLHTKYDKFNREVYTLWVNSPNIAPASFAPEQPMSEFRTPGTSFINGVEISYSNNVEPKTGHVLNINYYDDYLYFGAPSVPNSVGENPAIEIKYKDNIKPKGLPTGSWIRILESESRTNAIKSYSFYDKKARPARVVNEYPNNGKTQTDTYFNFINNPVYTLTTRKKEGSTEELKIREDYYYTPQSRLSMITHRINNRPMRVLASNSYDPLGRLIKKEVGGANPSGGDALQIVDYKYNIRGWLTDINNVNNLNQPGGGPIDLFAYKINYNTVGDDINGQVKPQFNGNISETLWRTAVDNVKRKYGYSYDGIHRLTAAHYQLPDAVVPRTDRYSTKYSYDENGNIHTLERKGRPEGLLETTTIDDLRYSYDQGNRLLKVKDLTNNVAGFNPGTAGPNEEYDYDDFGNLKFDPYKSITSITYNHLNLPVKIQFQGGANIEYTYAADGTKLEKTATDNNTVTTAYREGFQYTDGNLEFFPHQEGYVKVNASSIASFYTYVFNYTDHLGNIRLRYTQHPQTGETQILEEDHYYPFGLKHQGYNQEHFIIGFDQHGTHIDLIEITRDAQDTYRYKYQGQERQDELGLNWDSFKWRNYDYAIGRFFNIDPLAEQYSYQSPYNFAENRVVDGRELEGLEWTPSTSGSEIHYNVKVQIVNTAGLSDKKINKIAERIQKDFNKTYSQVDGYSASMTYDVVDVATSDYTIEVVDQIQKPVTITDADGNAQVRYVNGRTEKFGDTQDNNMKVSAKDSSGNNRSASGISKTTQHEIGHSAGLAHPWEKNAPVSSDIDQKTGDVKNGTIRKNLMNSDGNPNPALRNTSGTKLTPGQMETIDDTVNKNLGN